MANGYCTAQSRSRFSTDVLKIPQWLPCGGSQIPLSSPFSFLSVPPQRPWTQWNSPFLKITMLSISWDINSFGLGQLSSICLANSYFAFGAQLSNHFPHLMPWATSTLPLPLPGTPPMGLIAHIEHLARWILVPSLFVYIPHQTALWGQGTSLLCFCCILSTNTVPGLVEAAVLWAYSARSSGPRSRATQQHFLCTPPWRRSTGNVTDIGMSHSYMPI